MRALILHHAYTYTRFEQDLLARCEELPEFDLAAADTAALAEGRMAGAQLAAPLSGYDAIIVFVAFNALRRAPDLDWGAFAGLRVMFEHDAVQNYSDIFDPTLKGTWPPTFHRHGFHVMATSGDIVRERLVADGVDAFWVPKAFDPARFQNRDGPRQGLVSYGSLYRCRAIAERAAYEARLPLTRLPMTPHEALGAELSRFLACMAISSDLPTPPEQRAALDALPARDVPMTPGLEPMAKFFEGAGAGCCPVADAMTDLVTLGFSDGVDAILFSSHAEMVDKLRWWFDRPDRLRALGAAAAARAHASHTWAHRAAALRDAIAARL